MFWPAGPAVVAAALVAADGGGGGLVPPAAGLVLWLRADAGVELAGDRVVLWRDQSGRGHDAVAQGASGPHLARATINGLPAVHFDGSGSFLVVSSSPELNAGDAFSVFCVFRFSDGFRIAQKKSRSGGLAADAWFLTPTGGLGVAGRYSPARIFPPNRPHLQASVFEGVARRLRVFNCGELLDELDGVSPQQPNDDPVYLGKRDSGGNEGNLHGDVAELLIYSAALSDGQRRGVEAYLRAKYAMVPPEKPSLTITRIIPGHEAVSVEWLRPGAAAATSDLRYRVSVKLRGADWARALTKEVPGDATSASFSGLMNHADYELRVVGEAAGAGRQVAASAERMFTPGWVPGVVIDYLHKDDPVYCVSGQYVGSPSIARLDDGTLVASHDIFGPGTQDLTRVFRSDDHGETWRHAADFRKAFWGKLFAHSGELYLLACAREYGDLLLRRSSDGGFTWTEPVVIAPGTYHKAPVPVISHRGRLWTCVELQTGGWPRGFQAVVVSVPEDAEPMDPSRWTVSPPLPYDPAWLPEGWEVPEQQQGYLEGNAVVDPAGRLLNILRYNVAPHYRKAVVLDIAEDGRSLAFSRVIDFYGGMTKFMIRRHPQTGVYWSLVNRVTRPGAAGMRSVLTLVSSTDLDHWQVRRDLLRDDREWAPRYTGFQYVDWLFDDPDIIVASRTAWNGAHTCHDANYLTFHRVRGYASDEGMAGP